MEEKKTRKVEFWKVGITLALALISFGFNVFQYFDRRTIESEKNDLEKNYNEINTRLRNIDLVEKLPSFHFSYYQMDGNTFFSLMQGDEDAGSVNNLDMNHPLLTAKYFNPELNCQECSHVATLWFENAGGTEAKEASIEFIEYKLDEPFRFGFLGKLDFEQIEGLQGQKKTISVGAISPSQSLIFPLFGYSYVDDENMDNHEIQGTILFPNKIIYTTIDGQKKEEPIRKMLKVPFTISVNIDELG